MPALFCQVTATGQQRTVAARTNPEALSSG
jgi:hypothetical protein